LRQILQTATSHLKALEAIKRPVDHWDDLLIYLISSKFDYQTTVVWESTLSTAIPVMKHLTDFLNQRCQILESLEINKINKQSQIQQRSSTHVSSQAKGQVSTCVICKQSHWLYQCPTFLALTTNQRSSEIRKHNLQGVPQLTLQRKLTCADSNNITGRTDSFFLSAFLIDLEAYQIHQSR
jgi:hypothetical protein